METNNRFESVETKSYDGFDLYLAMTLSFLIPLEIRQKMRSLHISKYTEDGLFIHMMSSSVNPVVGVRIVVVDNERKKQQMFTVFTGAKNSQNNIIDWSISASSPFSQIDKEEDVFPFEELCEHIV